MKGKATGGRRVEVAWASCIVLFLLLPTTARPQAREYAWWDTAGLPPAGYGRLTRAEISARIETPDISVMVTPLSPALLRLLPADASRSFESLIASRAASIDSLATRLRHRPGLLLVTFYGRDRGRFVPEDLSLYATEGLLRPAHIIPISPRWNDRQLEQGETAQAVYVLNGGYSVFAPLRFQYGTDIDDSWRSRLRGFEEELARVRGRAAADRQ